MIECYMIGVQAPEYDTQELDLITIASLFMGLFLDALNNDLPPIRFRVGGIHTEESWGNCQQFSISIPITHKEKTMTWTSFEDFVIGEHATALAQTLRRRTNNTTLISYPMPMPPGGISGCQIEFFNLSLRLVEGYGLEPIPLGINQTYFNFSMILGGL